MININRARTVARLHLDNGMVVTEADAKLICQALLGSSERRRGLEEAAKIAEAWERNDDGQTLIADAIRALIPPSSEGSSGAVAPPFDPAAEAIDVACAALDEWADDLARTREEYIDAMGTGSFNGRRITKELAKRFAHDFGERASAVAGCTSVIHIALRARAMEKESSADERDGAVAALAARSEPPSSEGGEEK